jgi:hypothetical protein
MYVCMYVCMYVLRILPRMDAGCNTSTVALRVVE